MPSPPYSAFRINCGPVPASATFELDLSVLPWNDDAIGYDFATDWSKTLEFTWVATIGLTHQFRATSNGKFLSLYLRRSTTSVLPATSLEFDHTTSGYPFWLIVAITSRNLAAGSFWYWQPILWNSYGVWPPAVDPFQGIEIPVTRTDT